MTPYYSDDYVTIYHGDCRKVLPTLDRPDVILTDPPYGLGDKWQGGSGGARTSWKVNSDEVMSWDGKTVDIVPSLVDMADVVIIWGGNYYAMPPARCWLLWDKKQGDTWSTAQAEMAWTNLDRPVRVFRMSQVEAYGHMHKQHPTQKPLELISWCLSMARVERPAVVLDPFMGSGTTLRAAKDRGFKAIGIELNERYCEIAAERMAQEVLPLFGDQS